MTRPILLPYQKEYLKLCDDNRCVIVRKGRQSGFSFALSLWAIRERLRKNTNCYYISKNERTAKQFARYVKLWCEILNITCNEQVVNLRADATQTTISFPKLNKNFIQVMPAGEDVVRGLPGTVLWDECAFHPHGQAFYDATFPTIQAGHSFHIVSTIGPTGCFYENEWEKAVKGESVFKPFKITMSEAIEQGLADYQAGDHLKKPQGKERNDAFLNFIKKGMSKEAYDSEYECIQRGLGGLITEEEYQSRAYQEVGTDLNAISILRKQENKPFRELYCAIDPAYTHDLASIWVIEKIYDTTPDIPDEYRDVYATVCTNTWSGISPRALHEVVKQYISHPNMVKVLIDQGGPGYQLAQDLTEDFGSLVEPIAITNSLKMQAYERVKYFLQVDRLSVPKDNEIMKDFLSVTRKLTPSGQVTYEGRSGKSHADRFASAAWALHAAEHGKSKVTISNNQ